jgi:hypothetical protein
VPVQAAKKNSGSNIISIPNIRAGDDRVVWLKWQFNGKYGAFFVLWFPSDLATRTLIISLVILSTRPVPCAPLFVVKKLLQDAVFDLIGNTRALIFNFE